MRALIAAFGILLLALPAQARLGWTRRQMEDKYGKDLGATEILGREAILYRARRDRTTRFDVRVIYSAANRVEVILYERYLERDPAVRLNQDVLQEMPVEQLAEILKLNETKDDVWSELWREGTVGAWLRGDGARAYRFERTKKLLILTANRLPQFAEDLPKSLEEML